MAVENIILPFDNRIFIDFKSLPYIVLKIDEIEGLYSGTNKNIDKAFAHLLWDKDNSSEVGLSIDYNQTFSRQLKRGYCLMAPLGFEKKTFYPSPLSSLNSLTLNLMTPKGLDINNHPDVLEINKITLVEPSYSGDSTDSLFASATYTANTALSLKTGTIIGGGTNNSQRITLTFAVATSASVVFAVIGKDIKGKTIQETITGKASEQTATSTLKYNIITSITPNASSGSGAKVGVGNEGTTTLEIEESNGFPNEIDKNLIEIETTTFFSNRVLKIGDNINIKGFVLKTSTTDTLDIAKFINRDEGHYIINLEKEETIFNQEKNEGWIQKIYISPPGEIDFTTTTSTDILKTSSKTGASVGNVYYNDGDDTSVTCKLINQSLQSNYIFKVVTREDDFTNVVSSANI